VLHLCVEAGVAVRHVALGESIDYGPVARVSLKLCAISQMPYEYDCLAVDENFCP
jgi:hypothetical protein